MKSEAVLINSATGEVSCSAEVERIAVYVASWGRKSEDNPIGCTHPREQMCEQYGCSNFEDLADDIRRKFGTEL